MMPVICSLKYLASTELHMVKFNPADFVANPGRPIPAAGWAAGFAFMPVEAVQLATYDPHTAYVFDGEEFSMLVRRRCWR